jgi:gliding motility-associated-like protein
LSAPVDDLVSVTYSSLDGFVAEPGQDATTADSDYTSKVGTASFDARTTASQTITIPILGDYKVEDDEKVGVLIQDLKVDNVLVGPGSLWVEEVSVMTATTEGTIINDDAATIIVNDASLNAGNEFEGDISGTPGKSTFEVYLYDRTEYVDNGVFIPVSVDRDVSIQFISQDGDAGTLNGLDTNAGSDDGPKNDFVSANGTLVFPKNSDAAQIVQVTYVVDDEPENDEEFKVQLQNATLAFIPDADLDPGTVSREVNVDLANRTGLGLILNDDRPKFSVSTTGGSEDSGIVEFTISLDGPIIGAATVTVDYAVVGDTADQGVDYTDNLDGYTGTVTFVSGNSSTVVTLEVVDDVIGEGNEELTMTISNPQASNKAELSDIPGDLSATATITDNDVINVTVVTSDATIGEDGGTVTFTIDIDKDITGGDVTMDFDILGALVSGNTATVTNDYTTASTSGVITFPNGSMAGDTQTIEITLVDDSIVEGDEFVSVQLSNIGTTIPDGQAALNVPNAETEITDNDNAVISIADFTANESTEMATVVVSTSALIDRDVEVVLTTTEIGGTEAEDGGVDFATTSQTVVIPAEMTSGSYAIALNNDDLVEGDEDFNIAIGAPSGAGTMNNASVAAGTSTAVVTIDDDDSSVLAIAATASVVENVAGGIVNVAVTLSKAVDEDVTFTVNTADVSTDGDDFTAIAAMTFTINSGDTSIDVPVTITNTNLVELSETFTITISDLVVAGGIMDKDVTLGNDVSTVTITDDDQATISITNISDTEENLGGAQVVAITMNNPVDTDVTFLLNTVEGTAKSTDDGSTPIIESDFVKIEDQLITIDGNGGLAPNTTVFVTINDDDLVEADESFALRLGTLLAGGRNVVFSSAAATVDATVSIDETDKSTISLANITQSEALGTMNFDIQITKPIDQPVNLTVNTRVVTATPGADYTAISDATYVIPAGTLSASLLDLPVTIVTDNLVEATESFTLELSGLTVTAGRDVSFTGLGATLNASGTITDNDEAQITFDVTNNPVGTEGTGQFITFKIDMSNPVDQTVTFDYETDFNANATIGFDAENKSNQLTYGAGSNTDKTVTVNLVNNEIVEGDEFFDLLLTNLAIPAGRNVYFYDVDAMTTTLTLSETATIFDDDAAVLTIESTDTYTEGAGNAMILVSTDTQIDKDVSVAVSFPNAGGSDTAEDGTDYDASGVTSATITALTDDVNIVIPLLDGLIVEGTETFDVLISALAASLTADGYDISIDLANDESEVSILDNDIAELSIRDATVNETDGSIDIIVDIALGITYDSDVNVPITYAHVTTNTDGDTDVTFNSLGVTIDSNTGSGTATLVISPDDLTDGTETFTGTIEPTAVIDILNPIGTEGTYQSTVSSDNVGTYTIEDDPNDGAEIVISFPAGTVEEGELASIDVTVNGEVVDEIVTVTFLYNNGTADLTDDYLSTATIDLGDEASTGTLMVSTVETSGVNTTELVEGDEDFTVEIQSISVANNASHSVTFSVVPVSVVINDDDATVITLAAGSDVTEDVDTNASFVLSTSVDIDKSIDVDFALADGSANDGTDYNGTGIVSGTINAVSETGTVLVPLVGNTIVEGTETFDAQIIDAGSSLMAGGYNISIGGTNMATHNILDNDATTLSIVTGTTVNENVGSGVMNIQVVSDSNLPFDKDVTVQVSVLEGEFPETQATVADYGTVSSMTITIPQGSLNGTVTLPIVNDAIVDGDETFSAEISVISVGPDSGTPADGYDASIANASASYTILDDDSADIRVSANTSGNEGNPGDTGIIEFTVSLTTQVDEDITLDFQTEAGTANVVGNSDFVTVTNGLVTFPALSTQSQTITIQLVEDEIVEAATEQFTVNVNGLQKPDATYEIDLLNGANIVTEVTRTATINDDDEAVISITDATVDEETGSVTLTISMDQVVDKAVSITGNTLDGTAKADTDYEPVNDAKYTFGANGTGQNISVTIDIVNDKTVEITEEFELQLSGLPVDRNVVFVDASTESGAITITDVVDKARIDFSDVAVNEGEGSVDFTITMDNPVAVDVFITANTMDGTANAISDYSAVSGSPIIFGAGKNDPKTITIPIIENDIVEGIETFILQLSSISTDGDYDVAFVGGGTSSLSRTGTITDDDEAFISINNVSMNEGNDGTQTYTFNVTLDKAVDQNVTVDFATADGTAIEAENDYDGNSGTLDFTGAEGQVLTVPVIINGDLIVEDDEIFTVILDNLVVEGERKVSISTGTGTGTLLNDDSRPVITANQSFSITEDPSEIGSILGPVLVTQLNGSVVTWEIEEIVGVDENGATATVVGTEFSANTANASGEGGITVVSELDREKVQTYTLTMTVNDGLNTSEPVDVTVVVTDINDTAPVVTPATFSVLDNVGLGKEVGTVEATDADTEVLTTFDWLLEPAGNEDGIFTIDRETGVISILDNQNLDADDKDQYQLSVRVSDATSGTQPRNTSAAQIIVVNIIDTNDPPHDIILTDASDEDEIPSTIDIIETAGPDIIVGTLSTEDVDVGDTHSYTLVEGDGAINNDFFKIEGDKLVTNALMDFEITPTLSIRVRSTDAIGESFEKVFVINVVQDITLEIEFTNTITPNNDGINDAIVLNNIVNFPDAQVIIAIGSKVIYNNIGYTVPFNGTYNGNPLPTGAYPVLIKKASGQKIKGFIYILTN